MIEVTMLQSFKLPKNNDFAQSKLVIQHGKTVHPHFPPHWFQRSEVRNNLNSSRLGLLGSEIDERKEVEAHSRRLLTLKVCDNMNVKLGISNLGLKS